MKQQLDALYFYMRTDSAHEQEVQQAISMISSGPVQTYVRRMLEQRKSQDHPCKLARPDTRGTADTVSPIKTTRIRSRPYFTIPFPAIPPRVRPIPEPAVR